MRTVYQEALDVFKIQSGFVDEQIEEIYKIALAIYNSKQYNLFHSEYWKLLNQKMALKTIYRRLHSSDPHYIVKQDSKQITEEQMIEEISKLIYDYAKKGIAVNQYFIAELVEILVSYKGLHRYVKDIEFPDVDIKMDASYGNGTLKIYKPSLMKDLTAPFLLEKEEETYYPYYQTVSLIRHEIEHAEQRRCREESDDYIDAVLWRACNAYVKTGEELREKVQKLPILIACPARVFITIMQSINDRKYRKHWIDSPEERVADICGRDLALTIIEHAFNSSELKEIKSIFEEEILYWIFYGYDKPLGPTDFYLSQFKQYSNCEKIAEMSKGLSLEKRLLFGLSVTSEELKNTNANKEKVLSDVRRIC